MKTKLLNYKQINEVVSLLNSGEIVALPTETVYGLAADATNEQAINKVFIAKGRPLNHPLIVHIDSFEKLKEWAEIIPDSAYELSKNFWPGPLTLLLKKKNNVSSLITGNSEKIALRIPNHPITKEIIKQVGAIVAPSANPYKKLSPTKAEHVIKSLGGKISAVIDGGFCSVGIESTILDLTSPIPHILRPGSITKKMIEVKTKIKVKEYAKHSEAVPGNIDSHYQPETPTFLMNILEIKNYLVENKQNNIAVMHYSKLDHNCNNVKLYQISKYKTSFTKNMYNILHNIDSMGFERIIIELPPNNLSWIGVNDRLRKAAVLI